MTESEIIQGCLNGNANAEKMLFQRYAGLLMTVCRRYAHNADDAADILQDSFIKIFSNIKNYKNEGSFEGWIRKIAVNTALRNYQKMSFQMEETGLESYMHMPVEPDALSILHEEELINCIHQLPEGYKIVFNLYAIEGFSHAEISQLLGIQESTSRSQLTKARALLQKKIYDKMNFAKVV